MISGNLLIEAEGENAGWLLILFMKRLIVVLIVGGIFIISANLRFNYFCIESTDGVAIFKNEIEITNDKIEIKDGMLANSSRYVKGYKYYIKGDALYIKVYTSLIIKPGPTKLGHINLTINEDTSGINYVYLQGRNRADTELIWERSTT